MHILFLTDNFPPEGNAPATRTYEHAREWVKSGHQVTIVTCAPNFPEGIVFKGYKNNWFSKEFIDGIEVRRVKTYITGNEGFAKRILDYMSFMVSGFFAGLFVKAPDVIIATSPQFFNACAGWALSAVRRRPFVFELRDIWPASITAVGAMEKTAVIRMLEVIEMFLYRRADKIISVTQSFKDELVERGVEGKKIDVVFNGVDLTTYSPMPKDQEFSTRYGLKNKFVAGYIGTHGMAHALGTIIDTAELLKERDDIVFLFAGGGAGEHYVKAVVEEKQLTNVIVLGRQEKKIMPRIWSLCDVSIIHLKNTPLFSKVIPSKIFESMGMGLPMIIGVPKGEATEIIEKTNSGMVVDAESTDQMVGAIKQLADNPELRLSYRQESESAAKLYDRKFLADKMLAALKIN